jgi:MT0933-like antitoxin protein
MSDFLDKAKDLARDLGNKAQDAVSEHSDQIDDGIDKAADFVDDKTKHKYTDKIGKVQAKAHGLVEKAASKGGEGTAGGAAGDDA